MNNIMKLTVFKIFLKMFAIVCLFQTGMAQSLQGSWAVDKIIYEKEIAEKKETITYNTIKEVQDRISFPKEIEFKDAQNMILRYFNITEEIKAEYSHNDNEITITSGPVGYTYLYSIKNNNLTLTSTYKWMNRQNEEVTEKWNFIMKEQSN